MTIVDFLNWIYQLFVVPITGAILYLFRAFQQHAVRLAVLEKQVEHTSEMLVQNKEKLELDIEKLNLSNQNHFDRIFAKLSSIEEFLRK